MGYREILAALADETRRGILQELRRGRRSAGELAEALGVSPQALSYHLAKLKRAELVRRDAKGEFHLLRARPHGPQTRPWSGSRSCAGASAMKRSRRIINLLTLFPFAAAMIALALAPDEIPAHWGLSGEADRMGSKWELLLWAGDNTAAAAAAGPD